VGDKALADRTHQGQSGPERVDEGGHHRVLGNTPHRIRNLRACLPEAFAYTSPSSATTAKKALETGPGRRGDARRC
jgi:hypothetical protein